MIRRALTGLLAIYIVCAILLFPASQGPEDLLALALVASLLPGVVFVLFAKSEKPILRYGPAIAATVASIGIMLAGAP